MHRNGSRTGGLPRPLVSELPGRGRGKGDEPYWPKFLHFSYELGRLHLLGLLQALILSLRIADGLSQHLAQLSLSLRGFPLGWLPLGHGQ